MTQTLTADHRALSLDTNAIIYFLERREPYLGWLDQVFRDIISGDREAVISVIAEAELRVKPLRDSNIEALVRIDALLAHSSVGVVDVDRAVAHKAAAVRAELDLELPDALIVATAIVSGCDALIGNDKTCASRVTEIPYVYLDEVVKESPP